MNKKGGDLIVARPYKESYLKTKKWNSAITKAKNETDKRIENSKRGKKSTRKS